MAFDDNWTATRKAAYREKINAMATTQERGSNELAHFEYMNRVGARNFVWLLGSPFRAVGRGFGALVRSMRKGTH